MNHFVITDDHLKFKKFLSKHPEIIKVFDNIAVGQLPTHGFQNHPNVLIGEYIECLFLPLLEDVGVIEADSTKKSGYSSKYNGITFAGTGVQDSLNKVGHAIYQVCSKITEKDTGKNTLGAYVTGRANVAALNELQAMLRQKSLELLNSETCSDPNSVAYELGVVFHRELD